MGADIFDYIMELSKDLKVSISFEPNGTVEVMDVESNDLVRYQAGSSEADVILFLKAYKTVKGSEIKD
ncbi:MAG: hypothetical protein CMF22_10385 [Idiomarinaceae bacterium]|nr:hypothetical protein [Idiomarinaceae bacterium]MBG23848.1 hypothetical protein [Idiomarinaceae bacterium]|tara:strand:+ start:21303 stop:21506 length:204 start_codon:yes stop_codon:yes gene_type:complete